MTIRRHLLGFVAGFAGTLALGGVQGCGLLCDCDPTIERLRRGLYEVTGAYGVEFAEGTDSTVDFDRQQFVLTFAPASDASREIVVTYSVDDITKFP